jgi:NodT family efflux transporter outer membrane factor (OMF) lipoprotein
MMPTQSPLATPFFLSQPLWRLAQGVAAGLTLGLSGCAVGPDFVPPPPPEVSSYLPPPSPAQAESQQSPRFATEMPLDAQWWQLFGSEALNQLVQTAMTNNPSLSQANATLQASRENVLAGQGVFFPQANLGLSQQNIQTAPITQNSNAPGTLYSLTTLTGTVAYTFDFFGLQRRTVEQLEAQSENQRHLTQAAYLTLQGNVVNTLIARASYQLLIEHTQNLIQCQTEQLSLSKTTVKTGVNPLSDTLSLQETLASNQASLSVLQQKRDQTEHLLASLLGTEVPKLNLPQLSLEQLHLAQTLPLSLPSDLVQQRPDILSAQAQMHSASAAVGVATAVMFPSFSLNASYGSAANALGNLSKGAEHFWSVGPSLNLPLFEGGAQWHGRAAAEQNLIASQAAYRQTVLNAFAQVADCLTALSHDSTSLQAQEQARHAAQRNDQIAQANYAAGLLSYADRLNLKIQQEQAEMAYWQEVAQRHQDTVALFIALGGGWWHPL